MESVIEEVEVDKVEVSSSMHGNEFSLDEILSTESEVSKLHLDESSDGGGLSQKEASDCELIMPSAFTQLMFLHMHCGFFVVYWKAYCGRLGLFVVVLKKLQLNFMN